MWANIFWKVSWMCGLTGSRISSSGQSRSLTLGITLATDFPAWTILIFRSNIKWKGNTLQNVSGDISGVSATNWNFSLLSFSNSVLVGLLGVFGVVEPVSVIKNWKWSESTTGFVLRHPFGCWMAVKSLGHKRVSLSTKLPVKHKKCPNYA